MRLSYACTLFVASIFCLASQASASSPPPPDPPDCETEGCPDDGNACTAPAVCTGTGCETSPEPSGTVCDFAGSGDGVCDGASACVECLTDFDCASDGNDCTVAVCTSNVCGVTPELAGMSCDLGAYFSDGECDGGGGCAPRPPLLTQASVTCFPRVNLVAHVPPNTEARVYRDGVHVQSVMSNPIGLVEATNGAGECLIPNTTYSYQVSYLDSSGVESTLSGIKERLIADNPPVCPDPTCEGPDCIGGITAIPTSVPDQGSVLEYEVTSTTPGLSVEFEAITNPTGLYWQSVSETVTTGGQPTCLNGSPVYQATALVSIPSDTWIPGSSGGMTVLQARAPAGDLDFYSDWSTCANDNPAMTPDQLFANCQTNWLPLTNVFTDDFQGSTASAPTVQIADITCTSARVNMTAGPATIFLDGFPEHGYGSTKRTLNQLLPNQEYAVQVAMNDPGIGALSPVQTFETSACPNDGSLYLGVFLVRFQGMVAPEPFTKEECEDMVFNDPAVSFKGFIEEMSRGTSIVTGDVHGWVQFPGFVSDYCNQIASDGWGTDCNEGQAIDDVQDYLRTLGLGYDGYQHKALFMNGVSVPSKGTGGRSEYSARSAGNRIKVMAHEIFGHPRVDGNGNLGSIAHRRGLRCPDGFPESGLVFARNSACSVTDANYDPLGGGVGLHHFNSVNLQRLGWMSSAEVQIDATLEGDSTEYWLGALNSSVYPTKEVRVPLKQGGTLILEFRNHDSYNGVESCPTCPMPLDAVVLPEGVQLRAKFPANLVDWQTPLVGGQYSGAEHQLSFILPTQAETRPAEVLNMANPVFERLGVKIEVLEQDQDGARLSVTQ